ncbi:leucine-rich repeat protein, partial [Candidatus Poribacteria bacterium]|nr:leucine-rich repeat protein [Candidatus Poribacteria bacterium]
SIGTPYSATDVDADTLTYSLDDEADANTFDIDSETGQLKTKADLDFETQKTYSLTLIVSDGTLTDTVAVTIKVSDVNEAPVFAAKSLTTHAVAENTPSGESIGTPYSATDVDADTLTYSLEDEADAKAFEIDNETGQIKAKAALDYETETSYSVTISVSDGELTDTLVVTINISDVNEAPVFADDSPTTYTVAENTPSGESIGTPYSATDVDADTLTYSLDGTDADAFDIDNETGQLKTKAALDYETETSYSVTITVSDGELTDTITVTIDVTDVQENYAPVFTDGGTTTRSIRENTRAGVNIGSAVAATDPDGDTLTYSLGGTDADSFAIDSTTGQLQTKARLNFERKRSYSVTVSVSDGKGGSDSIDVTIDIINVYENRAPYFTGVSSAYNVPGTTTYTILGSKQRTIGTFPARDAINDIITYSLSGPDAASFSISSSGLLQTVTGGLNYNTKKTYSVTIIVSDDKGARNSMTVTINVLKPVTTRTSQIQNGIVAAITGVTDANNVAEAHLRSITSLTLPSEGIASLMLGDFDGLTGLTGLYLNFNNIASLPLGIFDQLTQLTNLGLRDSPLTELPDGIFDQLTQLTDLNLDSCNLTALPPGIFDQLTQLTDLNLAANALTALPAGIFDKNTQLTDLNLFGNKLTALPAGVFDKNTQLTDLRLHSSDITRNNITDMSALQGVTSLTELYVKNNSISSYAPLVTLKTAIEAADDSITIDITIDGAGVNNPPTFDEGDSTTRSVAENTASGQNIGTAVNATEVDTGHTLTYTLGGMDASSFSIVSGTGQLQTNAALDYETKNSYEVTVTVNDGHSGGDRITVTINVTDVVGAAPSVQTTPVIPDKTVLLTNYPNPFNPETWIPYQLATPADVTLTIYDIRGVVVRELQLGHQAAGFYQSRSRAIYWDGRNELGEKVATGVYFYTLKAGDYAATRKLLIRK